MHKYLPDGVIVVGRDSRPSGDLILESMCEQLVQPANCHPLRYCTNSTVRFIVPAQKQLEVL